MNTKPPKCTRVCFQLPLCLFVCLFFSPSSGPGGILDEVVAGTGEREERAGEEDVRVESEDEGARAGRQAVRDRQEAERAQ